MHLDELPLVQICNYLQALGATRIGNYLNKASVWQFHGKELLVPCARSFADYTDRIFEVVEAISRYENATLAQACSNIINSGYDIIRIRNISPESKDGTLPFEESVSFISESKNALLAAACSASTQKISYKGQKPHNAEKFMRTVRFGQTERGSFTLQILVPIQRPLLDRGFLVELPDENYERKVVPTLEAGLMAINDAAQAASLDSSIGHFEDKVANGVTTNLCNALVSMYESLESTEIEFTFSFSLNRPKTLPQSKVGVSRDYIPVIKEAVQVLLSKEPPENAECMVRGPVIKLRSENSEFGGEVTIRDIMSPKLRPIRLSLDKKDYHEAIKAHDTNKFIEAEGVLAVRQGKAPALEKISKFTVFNPADDAVD